MNDEDMSVERIRKILNEFSIGTSSSHNNFNTNISHDLHYNFNPSFFKEEDFQNKETLKYLERNNMPALFEFNIDSAKVIADDFNTAFEIFANSMEKLKNKEADIGDLVDGHISFCSIRGNHRSGIRDMEYHKKYLLKGIKLRIECTKVPILNYNKNTYLSICYFQKYINRTTDLSFLLKRRIKVIYLYSPHEQYSREAEGIFIRETDNCVIIQCNYNEKPEIRIPKLKIEEIQCKCKAMKFYLPSSYERSTSEYEEIENKIAIEFPDSPDYINLVETDRSKHNSIRRIYIGSSDETLGDIDKELTDKIFRK